MNQQQIQATQLLGKAVLETIAESGELGAPSGIIYAALMAHGITLNVYQQLLASMKRNDLILESPEHLLTITEKGNVFLDRLKSLYPDKNQPARKAA